MSNPFGSVGKQLGGLAKHVAKKIVREPLEVVENAVGVGGSDKGQENRSFDGAQDKGMEMVEQATAQANQQQAQAGDDSGKPTGFRTIQDYQKYQQLSSNKDEMEMAILRKRLAGEWGVEKGMQVAGFPWLYGKHEGEQQ